MKELFIVLMKYVIGFYTQFYKCMIQNDVKQNRLL